VNDDTGGDFRVVKLAGTTGAEIWRHSIQGSGRALAVAFDGAGDVLASGSVGAAFFVTKLSGTDGAALWQRSPGRGEARALALASPGDVVVVAGLLAGDTTAADLGVVKLDSETGREVWQQRIDGTFPPEFEGDWANAVAIDDAGDVLAAGRVKNSGTGVDFTVVKLAGATGTVGPIRIVSCSSNADCDDRDPCTVEQCVSAGGCLSNPVQPFLPCRSTLYEERVENVLHQLPGLGEEAVGGPSVARWIRSLARRASGRIRQDRARRRPPSERRLEKTARLIAKLREIVFLERQKRTIAPEVAVRLIERLPCLHPSCCPYASPCVPPRRR
jgi:hypothetical protein